MKQKNETETLNDTILVLQNKRSHEFKLIKEQFHATYEGLKPMNLLKSALSDAATSPGLKHNIVNDIIGLVTGYLSKKVLIGSSHNPLKRMFGSLMQFAIASVVSRNSDAIKSTGERLVHRFLNGRKQSKAEFHNIENS